MIDFEFFVDNKYYRWYNSIIATALLRTNLSGYVEKHHIIPKSFGTLDKRVVKLTAREHYLCHRLLPKFTVGQYRRKMLSALCFLAGRHKQANVTWTSRQYAVAKLYRSEFSRGISPWNKGISTSGIYTTWNKGITGWQTVENKAHQKSKLSEWHRNNPGHGAKSWNKVSKNKEPQRQSASKPVLVYGIYYKSATAAALDWGMKKITMIKRIQNKNFPEFMYIGEVL